MSLIALIAALLLERYQPLAARKRWVRALLAYAEFCQRNFNAGERVHGRVAWLLAVVPVLLGTILCYQLLDAVHPLLALLFNIAVLYLVMGFGRHSGCYAVVLQSLRDGKPDEAGRALAEWMRIPVPDWDEGAVARVAVEEGLLASHRTVFGVIVWFVLFSVCGMGGAAGALFYRLGQVLSVHWRDADRYGELARYAGRAFARIEWLPVRLTAVTFAVVGDFEDTLYCWRTQSSTWPDREAGILLSSGAGALGVRLGMARAGADRPELGLGDEADVGAMQSAAGLVWRSVLCWLILLLMLGLVHLLD